MTSGRITAVNKHVLQRLAGFYGYLPDVFDIEAELVARYQKIDRLTAMLPRMDTAIVIGAWALGLGGLLEPAAIPAAVGAYAVIWAGIRVIAD